MKQIQYMQKHCLLFFIKNPAFPAEQFIYTLFPSQSLPLSSYCKLNNMSGF